MGSFSDLIAADMVGGGTPDNGAAPADKSPVATPPVKEAPKVEGIKEGESPAKEPPKEEPLSKELEEILQLGETKEGEKEEKEVEEDPLQEEEETGEKGPKLSRKQRRVVESQFLATPRGQRMQSAFGLVNELAKPLEEGGLGFAPTAEEIKAFYQDHSDLTMVSSQFASMTPEGAREFLNQWFATDSQNPNLAGEYICQNLWGVISRINPNAAEKVAAPIFESYVANLRARVAKETDPKEKSALERMARAIEVDMFGGEEIKLAEKDKGKGGVDPRDREIRQLRQREQDRQSRQFQQFSQGVNTIFDVEVVKPAIEKALSLRTLKETFSKFELAAVGEKIENALEGALSTNPEGKKLLDRAVMEYGNNPSPQTKAKMVAAFSRLVEPNIGNLRAKFLKEELTSRREAKRSSDSKEDNTRHTGLGGGKAPTKTIASVDGSGRKPGQTQKEFWEEEVARNLGNPQ